MAIDPVTGILKIGSQLIDRLWPDPEQRDAAKLKLLEMQQSGDLAVLNAEMQLALGQIEVNKIEAAHPSIWQSGWRPGAGWVCVSGLAMNFVVAPAIVWTNAMFGYTIVLPQADMGEMMPLLIGLLGIGGLRSFDKIRGVAKN